MPLDRFAAVTALIDAGRARDEVLEVASLSREQWTEAQAGWLFKMAQQARLRRFELQNRFNEMLLDNLDALGRGEALEVADGCRLDAPPREERESAAERGPEEDRGAREGLVAPSVGGTGALTGVPEAPAGGVPDFVAPPAAPAPSVAAPPSVRAAPPSVDGGGVTPAPPPVVAPAVPPSPVVRRRPAMSTGAMPMVPPAGVAMPFVTGGAAPPPPNDAAVPFAKPAASPAGATEREGPSAPVAGTPFHRKVTAPPAPEVPAALLATAQGATARGDALPFGPPPAARSSQGSPPSSRGAGLPFVAAAPEAPPPSSSAGVPFGPAAGAESSLTETVQQGARGGEAALPFAGRRAAPPPVSADVGPSSELGQTVTADAVVSAGLPFDGTGEPRLTLEQFASLEAEMSMAPDHLDAVLQRYGLDGTSLKSERTIWAKRLIGDPEGRARFQQVKRDYKAWLTSQR